MKRLLLALLLTLAVLPATAAHAGPPAVVFDTDMDFDDAATLAYLSQEHRAGRIELRAITVTNSGAGLPGRAIRHARCLAERLGLSGVRIADGSGAGPNSFPADLRQLFDRVLTAATPGCAGDETPSAVRAPELIRKLLRADPSTQIIATGPLTNLAAALPASASRLTSMGGAVHVPGNLCCGTPPEFDGTQEFNYWLDPAAARAVLTGSRGAVRMVSLDAANEVPITGAFLDRLAADHRTPAADTVLEIVTHPEVRPLIEQALLYWWDPLAAMSAVRPGHVRFTYGKVDVVPSGPSAGRTFLSPSGGPLWYGIAADTAAFEQRFLDTLNGRP
ncbi:inosine-uridine nucleoside N-ribohydrolase [Nonomuraea thailandensis]|uniref:Inosine-uridine nucleoside N-ribohydrolase n=1 Tax=Nonomuraea thailandensis TaxID=1188745 RepID=A0A9X2K2Q9_9ACTN|nr:nucleoside hydrolase [Nonomuraea thailandensis]MCP2354806.1 inosine-uridine nucleoside N-ribohydrolase [Nonomuraea thailandensis]